MSAATLLSGGFEHSHTLALKQTVYVGVTMLVVLLAAMDATVPLLLMLSFLVGFLLVLYVVLLVCHLFLPRKLADQLFSESHELRTLLIGPVEKARDIANWIEETAAFGFGINGSVSDDDGEESRVLHLTRVSDAAMLERIIRHEGIKQILLLELPLDQEALDLIVGVANKAGVRLLMLNNLPQILRHDIMFFNLHNRDFISLRPEPLEEPISRTIKRTEDILLSLPIVIFILPLTCLLVKICQAIQSPGPLFSRETRSGQQNRPFRSFSFRTTCFGSQGKADGDRMYPLGRFLQRTGVD